MRSRELLTPPGPPPWLLLLLIRVYLPNAANPGDAM